MANLQGIIFDIDGTVLPSLMRQEAWFKFYSEMHHKSWPFGSFEQFSDFYNLECAKDGGVQNVYDWLGLPCNMNDHSHPVWPAYEAFNEQNPAGLCPGMEEALQEISQICASYGRKLRLAANTTNSWRSIRNDLRNSGVYELFDFIITSDCLSTIASGVMISSDESVERLKKPNPFSLALALQLMDCDGAEVMHVGDTLTDLQASYIINKKSRVLQHLITVGALYGYEKEKLKEGVELPGQVRVYFDHLITHPRELPDLIRKYFC